MSFRPSSGLAATVILTGWACLSAGCAAKVPSTSLPPGGAEADAAFAAAADRPPTAKTLYALARILSAQGKDAACEQVLTATLEKHPRYLPAYCELAQVQLRQRKTGQAVRTLRAGLAVDPHHPVLLNDLGVCRLMRGEYDQAMELFTEASAHAPDDARSRANLALALGMLGREDEALALYRQVMPERHARSNLAVIRQARAPQR